MDLSGTSVHPTAPWRIDAGVQFNPHADNDAILALFVGDSSNPGPSITIEYDVGGGGSNTCLGITVQDSVTGTTSAPFTLNANTPHTLTLIFDGTDLIGLVDGVVINTKTSANMTDATKTLTLTGFVGTTSDRFFWLGGTLTQA